MSMSVRPPTYRQRLWRWFAVGAVLLLLMAAYAGALLRVTERIGGDVQDSLRSAPELDDHTPRIN